MQILWLFTFIWFRHGKTLWPYRTVGPYLHGRNFTNTTIIHPFLNHIQQGVGATLVTHLRDYLFFASHFCELPCLLNVVGHRFLHIDVNPSVHSKGCCGSMTVV